MKIKLNNVIMRLHYFLSAQIILPLYEVRQTLWDLFIF